MPAPMEAEGWRGVKKMKMKKKKKMGEETGDDRESRRDGRGFD